MSVVFRFRVDKIWQSRRALTTSWLWSHPLLSGLSSLSTKSFRHQDFLRLSQTNGLPTLSTELPWINSDKVSATMRDKMDT